MFVCSSIRTFMVSLIDHTFTQLNGMKIKHFSLFIIVAEKLYASVPFALATLAVMVAQDNGPANA